MVGCLPLELEKLTSGMEKMRNLRKCRKPMRRFIEIFRTTWIEKSSKGKQSYPGSDSLCCSHLIASETPLVYDCAALSVSGGAA